MSDGSCGEMVFSEIISLEKLGEWKKKDFAYLNVYFQSAGDGAKSIIFKILSY